jgi:hypothetical protein
MKKWFCYILFTTLSISCATIRYPHAIIPVLEEDQKVSVSGSFSDAGDLLLVTGKIKKFQVFSTLSFDLLDRNGTENFWQTGKIRSEGAQVYRWAELGISYRIHSSNRNSRRWDILIGSRRELSYLKPWPDEPTSWAKNQSQTYYVGIQQSRLNNDFFGGNFSLSFRLNNHNYPTLLEFRDSKTVSLSGINLFSLSGGAAYEKHLWKRFYSVSHVGYSIPILTDRNQWMRNGDWTAFRFTPFYGSTGILFKI